MKKAEAKMRNRQQKNENLLRKRLLIAGRFGKKKEKMMDEFDDVGPSEQSGDVHRPEWHDPWRRTNCILLSLGMNMLGAHLKHLPCKSRRRSLSPFPHVGRFLATGRPDCPE